MAQNIKGKRFVFEFTRQSTSTPYSAQNAVSPQTSGTTVVAFRPITASGNKGEWLVPGGSYIIKQIKLTKSSNATTNASFDIYLYTSGVTLIQDYQPMALRYGDRQVRIGKVSITASTADATASDSAEGVSTDVNLAFIAVKPNVNYLETFNGNPWQTENDATIYAQVVATAAYTPTAGEKFFAEATIIRLDE